MESSFPKFVKNAQFRIDKSLHNTEAVEGYYYLREDGTQVTFWECHEEKVSEKHRHDFDEYMVCVSGEYTVYTDSFESILLPGDELLIPAGTEQWGRGKAGTRTIHVFNGPRVKLPR